jgi:sugar lactone lactonase YvrE
VVATAAGRGVPLVADGEAAQAGFAEPFGVAVAKDGSVYVADGGASNRIRKLDAQGIVTTHAGGAEGFADGRGAAASFNTPSGLALDKDANLYVADTGNNRIRKVTPDGTVTTLAGDGTAGFADGAAARAQFNGPLGVAVSGDGGVYVADTYNDRVRLITTDGQVKTIAGGGTPGDADGPTAAALFDTPCALVVNAQGELIVADTANNRLRRVTKDGQVLTLNLTAPDGSAPFELSRPGALALTHDGFLYVAEYGRGRVVQVTPEGRAHVIAGAGPGFADGAGEGARFNQLAGVAVDEAGALYVADSANYLVRKIAAVGQSNELELKRDSPARAPAPQFEAGSVPRLTPDVLGVEKFPWPLAPQWQRHELAATLGEARGSFDSDDSRHHLHSGVDVFGVYGETVRAVYEEKVASPLSNWGFDTLNEGLRVGVITYVHMRVGRSDKNEMFADERFDAVLDEAGKLARVRVRRGTRFKVGDALGTVNRMYHVHMNLGPPGAELNPLVLPLAGFADSVAPKIERGGVHLFDDAGQALTEKRGGRLVVRGAVRLVVDAYDQVDGNQARRRLGLYRLGYQVLRADGTPAPGFEQPRINIEFNRMPPGEDAAKIAYAEESGITVYGNKTTKFLYEVTNTVRDGRAVIGRWDTSALPVGEYTLRITATDYAGNEATAERDVPIVIMQ